MPCALSGCARAYRAARAAGRGVIGGKPGPVQRTPVSPAILQTKVHSWAVTGCTDNREYLTSAISLSFGSAFTAASVTGFGTGFTAFTSTALNTPFSSLGSVYASLM